MAGFEDIARAIEGLIDAVVIPLAERLGAPFNFILAGISGFVKAVIEQLLG